MTRRACSYAKKYKAKRKPKCGCKECEDKWNNRISDENPMWFTKAVNSIKRNAVYVLVNNRNQLSRDASGNIILYSKKRCAKRECYPRDDKILKIYVNLRSIELLTI